MRQLLIATALLMTTPAVSAEPKHRFSTLGALEVWSDETVPAHGIVMAAWDWTGLSDGARVSAEFNTDTLRFEYDGLRLASWVEFGSRITGEYRITNLLADYHQQGANVPERTMSASYGLAQIWLKLNPFTRTYIQTEMGVRRWFFAHRDKTAENFVLPAESWVIEPRLHATWWGLEDDAGWRDRHRLYPRLRGFAVGASLGLNHHNNVRPWGAIDPNTFDPIDPRNDPETLQYQATQWIRAGWQASPRLRFEWTEELGMMTGEDDLYRRQVGGLNPYVVNIPGVPWAYFHAGDYGGTQWSTHVNLVSDLEAGVMASAVVLRDVDRVGSSDFDLIWGAGALVDWRYKQWQFDLRGGYAPGLKQVHEGQDAWSVFAGVGWATD